MYVQTFFALLGSFFKECMNIKLQIPPFLTILLVPDNLQSLVLFCWYFSPIIYNLGVGCNWQWTLGSSWYCTGRDCTGYQKIVNSYLLFFWLYCFLFSYFSWFSYIYIVSWLLLSYLPVLNANWSWMFFGQDWVKLERIGDMYTR